MLDALARMLMYAEWLALFINITVATGIVWAFCAKQKTTKIDWETGDHN